MSIDDRFWPISVSRHGPPGKTNFDSIRQARRDLFAAEVPGAMPPGTCWLYSTTWMAGDVPARAVHAQNDVGVLLRSRQVVGVVGVAFGGQFDAVHAVLVRRQGGGRRGCGG